MTTPAPVTSLTHTATDGVSVADVLPGTFCRPVPERPSAACLKAAACRTVVCEQWRGEIKEGDARKRRLKCSHNGINCFRYVKVKNLKAIHNRNACCRCAWASDKSSYFSPETHHPSFRVLAAARYFLETGSSTPATVTLSGPACSTADLRTR